MHCSLEIVEKQSLIVLKQLEYPALFCYFSKISG